MEDVRDKVKEIKQSFRLMMDGAVAQSMRDKGLNYHLNWGATLPRLKAKAEELKANSQEPKAIRNATLCSAENSQYDLAIALWKENVRECKILATMLMPPEQMLPGVCDIWMEQIPSQEIAEQAAFNLWQYLPYAPEKAYVLSRLFMNGQEPNERGINEFIDQSLSALQGPYMSVRKAAMQSLQRFAELGLVYERMAKSATKSINLEFL